MAETYPDIPPDYGTSESTATNIIKHDFGDGYTEYAPNGINPTKRTFDMRYSNISVEDHDIIRQFLIDNVGISFYFTPPREDDQIRVRLNGKLESQDKGYNSKSLTFKLEQVFIP